MSTKWFSIDDEIAELERELLVGSFFPIEDPGFIVWNPVVPEPSPESHARMQAKLEKIWPPQRESE